MYVRVSTVIPRQFLPSQKQSGVYVARVKLTVQ